MGKIEPTFSHLLTVRAEGADPPSPPYGQPDHKKTYLFYDFNKQSTQLLLDMGKLAPNVQVTNGPGLFLEIIILRSDKLRNQGRGELLISLCHQVAR